MVSARRPKRQNRARHLARAAPVPAPTQSPKGLCPAPWPGPLWRQNLRPLFRRGAPGAARSSARSSGPNTRCTKCARAMLFSSRAALARVHANAVYHAPFAPPFPARMPGAPLFSQSLPPNALFAESTQPAALPLYPPRTEKAMGGAEVCTSFTEVFPSAYRPAALPCNGKAIFPARGPG